MSRPDEGLIHQWLDGECTPEEVARLEHLVATDPAWAAAVAEARGLIAASSRIVQALDAVPRAMPAGSTAAPKALPKLALGEEKSFRVRPWMRLAAGIVLVAGTAYALRERTDDPFKPAASVDTDVPATSAPAASPATSAAISAAATPAVVSPPTIVPPAARGAEELARIPVPNTVPPVGPVVTADRAVGERERAAGQGGVAPVLLPQRSGSQLLAAAPTVVSPPPAPPLELDRARRVAETQAGALADAEKRRAAQRAESPRGAVTRSAATPAAAPAAAADAPALTVTYLDGCWRITAPPELVAELARLELRRQSGDTLILVTRIGTVTAIRDGDTLRGGLQATRSSCPSTP